MCILYTIDILRVYLRYKVFFKSNKQSYISLAGMIIGVGWVWPLVLISTTRACASFMKIFDITYYKTVIVTQIVTLVLSYLATFVKVLFKLNILS